MKGTTEIYDLVLTIWNFELAIKELEDEVIEPALVTVQDEAGGQLRVTGGHASERQLSLSALPRQGSRRPCP